MTLSCLPISRLYSQDVSSLSSAPGVTLNLVTINNTKGLGSGNKQFKLHYNLRHIAQHGYKSVLSFGGAYSNHISALAQACKDAKLTSIGIIRGEAQYAVNETLTQAQQNGMTLQFVDRKTYRRRHDADYLQTLKTAHPSSFILPEGGSNALAVQGCEALAQQVNQLLPETTYLTSACGTGATLAGLIRGARSDQQVLGFSILKDQELGKRVAQYLGDEKHADYQLLAAGFGGYAKIDAEHLEFIEDWYQQTGVLLDPIYSSKMCRDLLQRINNAEFSENAVISMIHTGGLQGWWGMKKRVLQLGKQHFWEEVIEPYLTSKFIEQK